MKGAIAASFLALIFASSAQAASDQDIDKMTTYAVLLGRAIACGADTDSASAQIGEWMDKKFPPGSKDQQVYLPIFMEGVKMHMEQQQSGQSPDSCSEVKKQFSQMSWG